MRYTRSTPHSRQAPRITGSICPSPSGGSAHRDVDHAGRARGDDAHDDRARVRRASARHVHGGGPHGHLAQHDPLSLRELDRDVLADAGLRDERDVGDRDLQSGDELEVQQLERLVELLRGRRAAPRGAAPSVSNREV